MSRQADHAQHHPCRRHLHDKYHRRNICHHHHRHTTLIIQHCNSCQMLETTAPIAVFRTGQGIVPNPKVGQAGAGAGGGGRRRRGRSRTWGGGIPWGGGGVRDPRAYIYIYAHAPPPLPHDPAEPAFRKQWIMGGGQPPMQKHRQGSNFPKIPKILASMGSAGAVVAQILGILGKFEPGSILATSDEKTSTGIKFPQNS